MRVLWVLLVTVSLLSSCQGASAVTPPKAVDRYPDDITPPPGTHYPCALTPLPKTLAGVPEAERSYINRTYARVLRATQAKLVALKALEDEQGIAQAMERYDATTEKLMTALRDDQVPAGLESFRSDVVASLDLQRNFFRKAAPLRQSGRSMTDVYAVSEGREASARLMAAWGEMQARYPAWSEATKDSIYHHLCALDLF